MGTRSGEAVGQQDGWFAGLILDGTGRPRFTIATFVRSGGPGPGNAAYKIGGGALPWEGRGVSLRRG
jgi:hypothetical protein